MAEIVGSLFGITPDLYERQLRAQDEDRAIRMANLAPGARGAAMIQSGAAGLTRGLGGLLGAEDPQLNRFTQQDQLLKSLDLSDPKSLIEGAKQASSMGNQQLAVGLIDRAKALQESAGKIAVQNAQLLKAMQPVKLTGDERYIENLRIVETKLQKGEKPTLTELSNANISGQMLSKPRSYFDQASGQMVTQAATDPSKAFPLAYKQMGATTEGGATTTPKPTVQQATAGNIPTGSQNEIAEIESSLVRLENTSPQLDKFSKLLKSGDVKFNAAANAFDFLGAVVPPIFGGEEVGNQVKKDEFTRAFKERVNTVLNNAKGVQAKDDAKRAEEQIASPSTFLSSARMQGAIDYLKKAEIGYKEELLARKASLQRQGKPEAQETPSAKPTEEKPTPKPTVKPVGETRDQLIERIIKLNASNGKTVTRAQVEQKLRESGL